MKSSNAWRNGVAQWHCGSQTKTFVILLRVVLLTLLVWNVYSSFRCSNRCCVAELSLITLLLRTVFYLYFLYISTLPSLIGCVRHQSLYGAILYIYCLSFYLSVLSLSMTFILYIVSSKIPTVKCKKVMSVHGMCITCANNPTMQCVTFHRCEHYSHVTIHLPVVTQWSSHRKVVE